MKLLRYGPKGQEKPGLLDGAGKIRDLSGVVKDIDGKVLADLSAPLGTYVVLGNHDWWHEPRAIRSALDRVHLPILENDAVPLSHHGRRIWLLGLGDQLAYRLGGSHFRGVDDLPGTLAKLTTNDPAILLAHEPDIFVDVPARVALTLSGHTHGGQIWFPGMPATFIPSRLGRLVILTITSSPLEASPLASGAM